MDFHKYADEALVKPLRTPPEAFTSGGRKYYFFFLRLHRISMLPTTATTITVGKIQLEVSWEVSELSVEVPTLVDSWYSLSTYREISSDR